MKRLIADAKKARTPFFSAVAKGNRIIAASGSNGLNNPIEHAEMLAMGKALRKMKTKSLRGCTLYSTCESCPMCVGAIHWAGIGEVVSGARLTDSKRFGFDEILVPQLGGMLKTRGVKFNKDIMRKECLELFNLG
jgi:tRNA(Arg) A34 adenosine deaminase TadA